MKTVAVLRGGIGGEHEVSLKTGANVISHLQRGPYRVVDVFIDRSGEWHVNGKPVRPEQGLCYVDVVFNALHGPYGEDGTVQRMLDRIGVPYTGSGAYASGIAMNKVVAKEHLEKEGVLTPRHVILSVSPDLEKEIATVFRTFSPPSVIKPVSAGSSVGVTLAKTFDEFKSGIKEAFQHSKQVLVEEFIKGREATAGVVDRLRGDNYYGLPPVEIVPEATHAFFDYEAKYGGGTDERCPGNFSRSEAEELKRVASIAHTILGLRHYSRSDFMVTPKGIYFLEVNTLPGLTDESLLPKSLAAVGVSMPEFIDHTLNLALEKK